MSYGSEEYDELQRLARIRRRLKEKGVHDLPEEK